jgi:hypothetical protein
LKQILTLENGRGFSQQDLPNADCELHAVLGGGMTGVLNKPCAKDICIVCCGGNRINTHAHIKQRLKENKGGCRREGTHIHRALRGGYAEKWHPSKVLKQLWGQPWDTGERCSRGTGHRVPGGEHSTWGSESWAARGEGTGGPETHLVRQNPADLSTASPSAVEVCVGGRAAEGTAGTPRADR